jgi:DNA-directed RNA polymerase specialized sigma24 family protein
MAKSSVAFSKRKRENKSRSLLQGFVTGGGSNDDDGFLRQDEFLERGQRICNWIVRGTNVEGAELFNEAYMKTAKLFDEVSEDTAEADEKTDLGQIRDKEDFYRWFYCLAFNVFRDELRRTKKEGSLLTDLSERNLTEADPSIDIESECLVSEFMEFITKNLPAERRRAIALRQEGYTYREVADILNSEGVGESPSHVTVRKWIKDSLDAFFNDDSEE